MRRNRGPWVLAACLAGALAGGGCEKAEKAPSDGAPSRWSLERIGVVEGLDVPESVLVDPDADVVYVSNMETPPGMYWRDDGRGFLTLLEAEGIMKTRRWKESTAEEPLNEPKGMCVVDGVLYVADNARVVTYPLTGGETGEIRVRGAQHLNDMVAHGGFAYVSDTATGKIHKLGLPILTLKAPPSVNGITFDAQGRMFAVSWDLHDVYEVDPQGRTDPKPFGLTGRFQALDGIEVLPDGTFLVSDAKAGTLCSIAPDRKTVRVLAKLKSPADIGLDRRRMLLYVPTLEKDEVVLFRLRQR
jgi:hypothetical protein